MAHVRRMCMGLVAGLLLAAGCEERVVRTHNPFVGSQYEQAEKQRIDIMQHRRKKGPLESLGDTLFGWIDSDDQPAGTVNLSERQGQTKTESGGAGQ